MQPLHFCTLDSGSGISQLLDLVARKAPILMRCGGGPLAQEHETGRGQLSAWKREEALSLARAGLNGTEIALRVGATQSQICKLLHRSGVSVKDGRKGRISKRLNRADI